MSVIKTRKTYFAVLLMLAAGVAGCGSSGSSSSAGMANPAISRQATPFSGPAAIVKFGQRGSPSDLRAASKVLAENFKARQAGNFARQCSSLNAATQLEIIGGKKSAQQPAECGAKLEAMARPLAQTAGVRKDTFDGSIDEIRVKGARAWALYYGIDGNSYSIPMQREEGSWKVGSIAATEIG